MYVLGLGFNSIVPSVTASCASTSPELYQTASVYFSLSVASWCIVFFGYVLPSICVLVLLKNNGYTPSGDFDAWGNLLTGPKAAPKDTIDKMTTVVFKDASQSDCCVS